MKVFLGFSQDMVQDFTGLKAWELKRLREYKVVEPELTPGAYHYL